MVFSQLFPKTGGIGGFFGGVFGLFFQTVFQEPGELFFILSKLFPRTGEFF